LGHRQTNLINPDRVVSIPHIPFVGFAFAHSHNLITIFAGISRPSFTMTAQASTIAFPSEKPPCRRVSQPAEEIKIMGDRSPKSNQKKSTQKQSKADSADQKKKQAAAAISAAAKNR
jgi:hypothetical protein